MQGGNKYFYPIHKRSVAIEMFQALVEQDLVFLQENVEKDCHVQNGILSKAEIGALKTLKKYRKDLVFRQADKGGSFVVMKTDYKLEALRQLNDATTYLTLKTNPTGGACARLNMADVLH